MNDDAVWLTDEKSQALIDHGYPSTARLVTLVSQQELRRSKERAPEFGVEAML